MHYNAKRDMYRKQVVVNQDKEDYFDAAQPDAVALVPADAVRILEVGCGRGATLKAIKDLRTKEGKPCEVVGVDIAEEAILTAKERLDVAILMDAEEGEFTGYAPGYFDALILFHVLEHTVNPWVFLRRWLSYLKPGGHLIIAVPNIANHRFLRRLIFQDDFAHEPRGILDWTHLRYFTHRSLRRMLTEAGLEIDFELPAYLVGKKRWLGKLFPSTVRFFMVILTMRARKVKEVSEDDYQPCGEVYTL